MQTPLVYNTFWGCGESNGGGNLAGGIWFIRKAPSYCADAFHVFWVLPNTVSVGLAEKPLVLAGCSTFWALFEGFRIVVNSHAAGYHE
jgi:hypothetical protein